VTVKEHLDAETCASYSHVGMGSALTTGNLPLQIAVAYNVFSTGACGEKTARTWFAEEAMTW